MKLEEMAGTVNLSKKEQMIFDYVLRHREEAAVMTGAEYMQNIYVYTENERLTYEIYEAAKFTDVYIPSEYVISSKDDRDQFLADVREKVSDNKLHVREDMEIGEDDRLITLSTCVSGERNHRYLVIGVLVETALYR